MCNLYQPPKTVDEIRKVINVEDQTGNESWPDFTYPNREAPIISLNHCSLIIERAKWGMPSPAKALTNRRTDPGVSNVRNLSSFHWQRWLGVENRCLVPFRRFAEPHNGAQQWFELDMPLGFFAGIMVRSWRSVRRQKDGETEDDLFAFLTCSPNEIVAPIHEKAMPVILTDESDFNAWLDGVEAKDMQRPYPATRMRVLED